MLEWETGTERNDTGKGSTQNHAHALYTGVYILCTKTSLVSYLLKIKYIDHGMLSPNTSMATFE